MKIGALLKFYESGYNRYGDEKYKKIKEHGFDCVDFNIMNTETELYQADEERFKEILLHEKALAEDAGIKIHQVHGPWRIPQDSTETDRQERMEKMQKSIRAASILECKYWVIHPLMPCGVDDLVTGLAGSTWEINLTFMRKLLETAKEYGITICLENMPMNNFSISTPEKILEFVQAIDNDHFKICLDTGHLARFKVSKTGDAIRLLGDNIKVLHTHDNMGDSDTHQFPYTGIIDWKDFGKALKDINFDGVLSMETAPKADLSDDEFEKKSKELAIIARKIVE